MIRENNKTGNQYQNQHVQMDGIACIDHWTKENEQGDSFFFTPNAIQIGSMVSWRHRGTAQLMSDGTFEFVKKCDKRSYATLIKKLPHGRLSVTKDGYIQLTLKFRIEDQEDIATALLAESAAAAIAIGD